MKTKDWILLSLVLIGFEILLYVCTPFEFALVVNGCLILFVINLICMIYDSKKKVEKKSELNHNQFHKILATCIEEHYVLSDPNWHWEIIEFENEKHKYHVIGSHPTCKRIDVIKTVIV